MAALGVITLILLVYSLIFYAYLANHSEHDVSFFMSVSLIMLVMNLCTNASGAFGLSWLYLVIALVFIGVGFAVDKDESIDFYKSVVPWFKTTFTDTALLGYRALSFIVFPAGMVFYFVKYNDNPALSRICGRCSLFGLLMWVVLLWMILGLAL